MKNSPKVIDARLLTVALFSALLVVLLVQHTSWLNGPTYWKWQWRQLDALYSYPLLLLATLPFIAGHWLHLRGKLAIVTPLLLVMATFFLLQLVALGTQSDPFSLGRIAWIVEHPYMTSFYNDAQTFTGLREWLGNYPDRMSLFHLHSQNKPPGPILYYVLMIKLFGGAASQVGGILVGILATLAIPATYLLIRTIGGSQSGAFWGASFLALCPGPVLFFPEFDQLYPLLTCAVIVLWVVALKRNHLGLASAFGVALFMLTFFSFGLLVIGLFLVLLTLNFLLADPRRHIQRVAVQAGMGLSVVVLGYVVLWLFTGFDPLATFSSALQNQEHLAAVWQRPYPQTIVFDLTDFALGTGWISFLLAGLFLARHRSSPLQSHELRMAICCLGQIVFIGVAGLIPTETARVWIFLMPLLMFPVGEELVRWSSKTRAAVFGCMWLLLAAIHQNLVFISPT